MQGWGWGHGYTQGGVRPSVVTPGPWQPCRVRVRVRVRVSVSVSVSISVSVRFRVRFSVRREFDSLAHG